MTDPATPASPRERLRAFEDSLFPNHPRPNDEIERGIGSPFSALDGAHKAHHAALEALIAADDEYTRAAQAEAAAQAKLDAATKRADDTEAALAPPAAAEPPPPAAEPPPAAIATQGAV